VPVTARLPQALLVTGGPVTRLVVERALGPVLALRDADRDTYLATLEALLDCDGSYAAAARRLFCHRNTVIKRVQRVEALTGLQTARTDDLVQLRLALLAHRVAPG
jgi:DNA-binding PucR family transcriptional regulator